MSASERAHADARCRARYVFLARECRRRGLDAQAARQSAAELSRRRAGIWYLHEKAFKPTGIALGCPLPDQGVARRLWRVTRVAAERVARLDPGHRPSFSLVPRDGYHMTLVHRSHYTAGGAMTSLGEEERRRVEQVVAGCALGTVAVHLNGLLLTRGGRLIVPGFPTDDRLYELRSRLAREVPSLAFQVPVTFHVKVGHLTAAIAAPESDAVLKIIDHCGDHVSARLVFHDLYSPAGRIAL